MPDTARWHKLGKTAEDMENNIRFVRDSDELKQGVQGLADRAIELAQTLIASGKTVVATERGGRKANPI